MQMMDLRTGIINDILKFVDADPELQEAAIVDDVTRIQRINYVDISESLSTVIFMLIFNCASVANIGMDRIFLMQNDLNASVPEITSTFVYKTGVVQ